MEGIIMSAIKLAILTLLCTMLIRSYLISKDRGNASFLSAIINISLSRTFFPVHEGKNVKLINRILKLFYIVFIILIILCIAMLFLSKGR
ncbi:hypothetical protein C5745_12435 [Sphingobacterium haloxyli]|uniref:Uncharacterized protein n=1 Tax=Sphingobacterium haloxyli TaxID=2100533 RepID=A0A2S9J336_9SPHI|nr:hypothetical protein C5745_12435 [Sphingobacterium haloxyli]